MPRPRVYSDEELYAVFIRYITEHPYAIVTSTKLASDKYPEHAFRYRKTIKEHIEKYNEKPYLYQPDTEIFLEMTSAEDFVENNYRNKKKLIFAITKLLELYHFSFHEAKKVKELEFTVDKQQHQMAMKDKLIEQKTNEVEYYKEQIKKLTIDSTSAFEQDKQKIKNNLLDLNNHSKLISNYKELFDN